jgi:hypothetical protein
MTNLRWTEAEDSIIAVVNYLYKDPYGLIVQKALANHRLFPFQSSMIAPSGQSFSQEKWRSDNSVVPNGVNNYPSSLFPMRTLKQVLDRVLWQQRGPQDTLFEEEAIIKQPRFAEYLTEFTEWRTNSRLRKNPSSGGNGSSPRLKQEDNKTVEIDVEKDDDSMYVEVKVEPDDKSMPFNSQVYMYIYSYIFIY